MIQKIAFALGGIIILLLILYAGLALPVPTSIARSDVNTEQIPFALRGNYTVGIRELVIEDKKLPITMWYPAINEDNGQTDMVYSYPVKMGDSFMLRFATYKGLAIEEAQFDLSVNPYPLVILSPGFSMGTSAYGWIAEHLASHGFVVIAPEHQEYFDGELNGLWQSLITRPQDILTVLDYVDEQVTAGGMFEQLIDADSVAVIGHSYGGYTILAAAGAQIDTAYLRDHCGTARAENHPAAWLCDEIVPHLGEMATLAGLDAVPDGLWQMAADPRIDAIVPMAGDAFLFGQSGLAEITVPVMAISGTADHDSPFDWAALLTYEHSSSTRKILIGLEGAEHMIFTAPCEAIPLFLRIMSDEFCADGDWNRYHVHNIVKHFVTAFLLAELSNNANALNVIRPDAVNILDITYNADGY